MARIGRAEGMANLASVQATVHGHVQGVFFRAFVSRWAMDLGLTGYVRNLPGGKVVEVRAEGDKGRLEQLIDYLKVGPAAARVEQVVTNYSQYTGAYSSFTIRY